MDTLPRGTMPCTCSLPGAAGPRRVALTGGPGAGKTAVLQLARRSLCSHVILLPESASIVFGGGFPRLSTVHARKAVQRAIFHIQRELETVAASATDVALVVSDRGTLDGVAYWPEATESFWHELGVTREQELVRYDAVIHLRTPNLAQGYNHDNVLRIESNDEALLLDRKIEEAWQGHPNRLMVASQSNFVHKALQALAGIVDQLPPGCTPISLSLDSTAI